MIGQTRRGLADVNKAYSFSLRSSLITAWRQHQHRLATTHRERVRVRALLDHADADGESLLVEA